MFCFAGLIFLQFTLVVLGEGRHCHFTSNNQSNASNSAVVDLHQSLVINCFTTLRNSSNLTFEWYLDKINLHPRVPSVINMTAVISKHAGIFKCVIKHDQGLKESCEFMVIIKAPPRVIPIRYDGMQQKMSLECTIKGYFKPNKIVWYKNNKQIFTNRTEFFVENKDKDKFTFTSRLQKNYPNLNDSALYSCEATNIYGTSRANTNVTRCRISSDLHDKCPKLKDKQKEINVTVMAGSSTSLLCEVLNLPCKPYTGPSYFGLYKIENSSPRDIGVVKNHYNRTDKGNGDVLINFTIVNANKNDSGKYRCNFVDNSLWYCPLRPHKVYNVQVVAPSQMRKKQPNLPLVIAVSVAGALCGLGLVLYICHLRKKLKSHLYDSCPDYLPELRWDVFVSYSSHDFGWVDDLCQMLEQPPFNLTVCLHQRDWELGRSVVDNMVDSVYCSHKTLIIVSKNYVQSDYCMQELQIAMHSEIAPELVRRERIVLIKIDDVSMHCLPRVIRQKSYLDCSDPENAKHLKTNLLRVLPRRERVEEQPLQDGDQQSFDNSNAGGSAQMPLQQLQVT